MMAKISARNGAATMPNSTAADAILLPDKTAQHDERT